MTDRRLLGITVLGDFILSEGVECVLSNLQRVGATAVATNPTVTAPAPEGQGSFQPPIDAGSSPRLFDRPLFGKHALWVRSGVSFKPRAEHYTETPYGSRTPNDLTEKHGQVIGEFISAAKNAGMKVYLQVGAVQPTGLRDEDRPRLPDGQLPPNRMADTGSLASDAIRAYNRAYVADLMAAYPAVDGFRPDWPEYPCYTPGEVFQDFSPHVASWADQRGLDFAGIRDGMAALLASFEGLTNDHLRGLRNDGALNALRSQLPVVDQWLKLKAELSVDCLRHWREVITAAAGPDAELSANAFMPRYSDVTGLDFGNSADICDAVSPKLYTMHWSQMVTFWGNWLKERAPDLDAELLTRVLARLMDIDDDPTGKTLADFGYPAPDEPHPIADGPQKRKITEVIAAANGRCDVTPLVHGYGPPNDFRRRLQIVADSDADGVWINRYGYLGEEKLNAIAQFA